MSKNCPDCGKDWGHSYCGTCGGTGKVTLMSKDDKELAESLTKNRGDQSYLDQVCRDNKRFTDIKRRVELALEGNLTDPQACYHRDVTFLLRQLEAGD